MSQDTADFNSTIQSKQFGALPSFFPVIINPLTGGPNGTPMQLNVPYPVNISPCDHLWLPATYDASLGYNPRQNTPGNPRPADSLQLLFGPWQTASMNPYTDALSAALGFNAFDVWNQSGAGGALPILLQSATVFALQFNSPSAPWLLWSLSDFVGPDLLPGNNAGTNGLVGMGDSMRSISGPIASMNVKIIQYANIFSQTAGGASPDIPGSQVVMLSSLGYSQQTMGGKQLQYGDRPNEATLNGVSNVYWPQSAAVASTGFGGGGYHGTTLNTLERLELACRGQGQGVMKPDGTL